VEDIVFPGHVNILEYLEKIDFTILTSLSEGQPYAVLESLAAERPLVATDVGSCRELIEGEGQDRFGPAGMFVTPMHQGDMLAALVEMCQREKIRKRMGIAGKQRVQKYYNIDRMLQNYLDTYQEAIESWQE